MVQKVVQVQPLMRVRRVVGVGSGSGRTGQGRLSGSRAGAGLVHVACVRSSRSEVDDAFVCEQEVVR
jgi:hypothetical protein